MAKAGKYEYPTISLDVVEKKLRKYHETIKADETKRKVMADTLGMSMSGGRFMAIISSMEKYGLIQTGGKKIRITDQGKLLLYGTPADIKQARQRAVSSVKLFAELCRRYGKTANLRQIRAFLLDEANVDISEAEKTAKRVDKIYKKVSNHITVAEKPIEPSLKPPETVSGGGRREISVQPKTEKSELLKIQLGDFYVQVQKEDAEEVLRYVAQKLGIDLSVKKKD